MPHGTGITWPQLHRILTTKYGCTENGQQVGSHIGMTSPNGHPVPACDPNKHGYVSPNHLREVSRAFGLNTHDFLIRAGVKPPGKAKETRKRSTGTKIPPPFQSRIAKASRQIERTAIRIGHQRTASFNRTAVDELERLAREIGTCEKALTSGGAA